MALADKQNYWNYGMPCVAGPAHIWEGRLCTACGLQIKRKVRDTGALSKRLRARGDPDECFYCEHVLDDKSRSVDHVIPRSRGGSNILENLVLCCKPCNADKRDRLPEEWKDRWYNNKRLTGKAKETYFRKHSK